METSNSAELSEFSQLELKGEILSTLSFLGYETPTPIQAHSIPLMLAGTDVLAQAQTGTGKTAAFALPILSNLNLKLNKPQALVVVPTRELAIQVAEAFQSYAKNLKDFHVTPIYGGQDYSVQLRSLKRGTHVIVGTPGRLMDHMRRGSLWVDELSTVVLDEADEMLKMGFQEDVEWILEQITHAHQTALFSATMPASIVKISKQYLHNPEHIKIAPTFNKVDTIEQSYVQVKRGGKLDTLTRFLEIEDLQAAVIFVRTKTMSSELAEKLQARGYAASPLNGDMNQPLREKVIGRLKKGTLDILVATDVAARGIDVERISLVVNYDIPYDTESYIHRIGRTGRAGRQGRALLLVTPREQYLLKSLQKAMNDSIIQVSPPTRTELIQKRDEKLMTMLLDVLGKPKKLDTYQALLAQVVEQEQCGYDDIAAALLWMLQKHKVAPEPSVKGEEQSVSRASAGDSTSHARTRSNDRVRRSGSSRRKSSKKGAETRFERGQSASSDRRNKRKPKRSSSSSAPRSAKKNYGKNNKKHTKS